MTTKKNLIFVSIASLVSFVFLMIAVCILVDLPYLDDFAFMAELKSMKYGFILPLIVVFIVDMIAVSIFTSKKIRK